ncbi:uncharacterized protein LOC125817130 [Solanum verrucosum]|uniref:uncharacterized protein LOC125817130 n=1 Tax=Solanum verrucosum TaxID=315347 RepID=UPI0020D0CEAA|nr:uncharacterized protein LOC125817130 [Solanum verrucosum]
MIFLRHHLDEGLKVEYLTVKDPLELWTGLKERYDHLKAMVLPRARYEWIHLRLQDFKTICEYNSAVYKITSQLKLCGEDIKDEDMLEKTLTTFHASNLARPTGTVPLPEANEVEAHGQSERRQNKNQGQNNVRGRGNGIGRYNNRRGGGRRKRENNMGSQNNPSRGNCHRCGLKGHWKNECRAAEHFVRLYQDSLKRKGNKNGASSSNARVESHLTYKNDAEAGPSQKYDDNIEANLALKDDDFDDLDDITHLEVEDFFGDQN